jgi:hypothetical protein
VLKRVTYQATLPAGSTPDSCCIELTNPGSVLRLTQLSTTWRQAAHFIPIHPTWRVASRQSTEFPARFYRCTPWIGDSSPGRTARASTTQVSIMSRSTQQQLPEASGTRQAPAPAPAPPPPQSTPARRPVPSARSSNTTHTSPGTTLAASPSGTSGSRKRAAPDTSDPDTSDAPAPGREPRRLRITRSCDQCRGKPSNGSGFKPCFTCTKHCALPILLV